MTVENSDTYTMVDVSRDTTGEYKCSLIDNPLMESVAEVTVKCKNKAALHNVTIEKQLHPTEAQLKH